LTSYIQGVFRIKASTLLLQNAVLFYCMLYTIAHQVAATSSAHTV